MKHKLSVLFLLLLSVVAFAQEAVTAKPATTTTAPVAAPQHPYPYPLSPETRSEVQGLLLEMSLFSGDVRELGARLEGAQKALREIQERLGREIAKAKIEAGVKPEDTSKWTINARGVWVVAQAAQQPAK
jgi:hypothetical protein